jgi:hypothetical protein
LFGGPDPDPNPEVNHETEPEIGKNVVVAPMKVVFKVKDF